MKKLILAVGAMGVFALPTAAAAQDEDMQAQPFIGLSAGIHDLGAAGDAEDLGVDIDDSGEIFGVFAGVDFPLSDNLFAGVEGNFHLGSGPIDSEYGASARVGFMSEQGSKFYLRGGYQEVDIDPFGLLSDEDRDLVPDNAFDGVDTSAGDYLVGAGADFLIGDFTLRANVDTIGFDTVRATAGVAITF